ncbi:MAG: monovalent cation:proton antiporter-2 (CPA2) family protein [Saprospiraceae bacterium]|nr:monovalent cation:proton antiporter-2 (CPA2) family protein [Saprospiraceae bacterium]
MQSGSFFYIAFVYLAAAVVMVPLAKRFGLGSVLGYLLAGLIIGPEVLGLVGEERQEIMHFAEFGVVMMLFVIGLELEPSVLWRLRINILGMGGVQVVATTLVFFTIGLAFGLPWKAAIAVGLLLSLSSTAIILQTLQEKGLIRTPAGQSSFAVLLFQDIAVIPILALFPLLADASFVQPVADDAPFEQQGWMNTLLGIGAIAAIIVGGKYLVRPIFHAVAKTKLRELFTATALLLVIAIELVTSSVGLSPALGAFLGGVVLANSEYRHELESDIEPFKGLLLGTFFISIGASINLGFVAEQPIFILSAVLGVMLIKGMILFAIGRAFRMGIDQNSTFAFALCQMGEFAFVLLTFASRYGIFPEELSGLLLVITALSMALTPLFFLVNEKMVQPRITAALAKDIAPDVIEEKNPVIIAGFGRFGSVVGRLLKAKDVGTTVLDNDADRVELLRKLGLKVYYGDASRLDLLQAAGAKEAKLLIIALDDPEQTLRLVEEAQKHFPHLALLVRATDRPDAYDLLSMGVKHVYRETLDTSLRMGADAMQMLGFRAYNARNIAQKFYEHDEKALRDLADTWADRNLYISAARERIAELEQLLRADGFDNDLNFDKEWDSDSLREDVLKGTFK